MASGLRGLDVSAEAPLCTGEASARKTKISLILRWHGCFPVSPTKSTMPFFFVGDSDFVTNFLHLITET